MAWVIVLSAGTIVLAGAPYVVLIRLRQKADSRRLSYEELSAVTGTYGREELDTRFGPPDEDETYSISADLAERVPWQTPLASRLKQAAWCRWLYSHSTSFGCLLGACLAVGLYRRDPALALVIAAVCAGVQVIRWGMGTWCVLRTVGRTIWEADID